MVIPTNVLCVDTALHSKDDCYTSSNICALMPRVLSLFVDISASSPGAW